MISFDNILAYHKYLLDDILNAPKGILAALKISVVGSINENTEEQVIVIKDKNNFPSLIICAVPFLRERDVSRFTEGETYADRSKKINEGIKKHYEHIAKLAEEKRKEFGNDIPIIATGHLSVAGGKRNDDDGVRETYIGGIEVVGADIFPNAFDYVALGHYHIPSCIKDHIRYCGSPIPMGFGEAGQNKCVYVIDFDNGKNIHTINIPVFQKLEAIIGDKYFIKEKLEALKTTGDSVWVEVTYNGEDMLPNLTEWVNDQVVNTSVEVLKIQNRKFINEFLKHTDTTIGLDSLEPQGVFNTFLNETSISEAQKSELNEIYKEVLDKVQINPEQI